MIQTDADKISIGGFVQAGDMAVALTADAPRAELGLARAVLEQLHTAVRRVSWHVDIQDGMLTIHTDRHTTFSYRMPLSDLSKGQKNIRSIGCELIERIEAGAC
jgi:hypothetical protein